MPGSISISVVEWIDVHPQESISIPHFLKVYLGKKEFQNNGKENFSLPVISLRDNLIIMLCDVEGNIVTKSELRTILVVEKGETEVTFPLVFGTNVKLRLKFILSEEEREKIREIRNLALKRKHEELIKGTHETSSHGTSPLQGTKYHNNPGIKKVPKRLTTETDQVKIEEHDTLIMVEAESNKIIENETPVIVIPGATIEERKPLTTVKEENKSLTIVKEENVSCLEDSKKKDLSSVNKRKGIERNTSGTIKKMISAFESNAKQQPGPHIRISSRTKGQISKIPSQDSLGSMSYENEDIKQERRVSRTLSRKSFSLGDLSEAILQNEPSFAQGPQLNQTIMFVPSEKEDLARDFAERPLFNEKIMFISNETEDFTISSRNDTRPSEKKHEINILSDTRDIRSHGQEMMNNSKDKDKIEIQTIANMYNLNDDMNDGEKNAVHEIQEVRLHDVTCLRNYEKLNEDTLNYSFQIFDLNIPRHLCITTGPKTLRDMLENFNISLTSDENTEKKNLNCVASEEENEELEIKNQADQKFGGSILNGWLIDKGARILIVIIACGTIILNTR